MLSELWVDQPGAEARAERYEGWLGEALRSFLRDGYAIIPNAVQPAAIDRYLDEFGRLLAAPGDVLVAQGAGVHPLKDWDTDAAGSRVLDTFLFAPAALELMFAQRLETFLRTIFDDEILAFQSLHFEVGSTQLIHQDTAYVVVDTPLNLAASWVALEDVEEGSGELVYFPGSHRFPHHLYDGRKHWNPELDGAAPHDAHLRGLVERAAAQRIDRKTFRPKKGDALIWHADLAHGGGEITKPHARRRSFVTHYCPRHSIPHYFTYTPHARKMAVGRNAVSSMYYDREPQRPARPGLAGMLPRLFTARPRSPEPAATSAPAASIPTADQSSRVKSEPMPMPSSLKSNAFKAWDRSAESLEDTEQRIHDGASSADELRTRGRTYVETMRHLFPHAMPRPGASIMEIGSGVGYVMEAAADALKPARVIGLDVAPAMIEKAKLRITRDVRDPLPLEFLLYDGVRIPIEDNLIDYVYSVASLQHVPKHLVYNLIFEIKRILKPDGWCAIHLLSVNHIAAHDRTFGFRNELKNQIEENDAHWHHFYSFDELVFFLADAADVREIDVVDGPISIWASFGKTGRVLRRDDLLKKTHLGMADDAFVASKLEAFERRTSANVPA